MNRTDFRLILMQITLPDALSGNPFNAFLRFAPFVTFVVN